MTIAISKQEPKFSPFLVLIMWGVFPSPSPFNLQLNSNSEISAVVANKGKARHLVLFVLLKLPVGFIISLRMTSRAFYWVAEMD